MANKGELADGSEGLLCYVCNVTVVGWYHYLNREVRMFQKLNEILGAEYMAVISEADVICRGCSATINSLEQKEKEVSFMKSKVHRNLVKKYGLEGEIKSERQQEPRRAGPVKPQRKTLCKAGRGKIWIRCDQCDYKTSYTAFMVYHIRTKHWREPEAKVQEKQETVANDEGTTALSNGITNVDTIETEIIQNPEYDYGDTNGVLEDIEVDNELTLESIQQEDNNNVFCFVDNNDLLVHDIEETEGGDICDVPVVAEEGTNNGQQLFELVDEFLEAIHYEESAVPNNET